MIEATTLPDDYISSRCTYAEQLLSVSNNVIVYNLLKTVEENKEKIDESEIVEGASN